MSLKTIAMCGLACAAFTVGCGGAPGAMDSVSEGALRATIGPAGGELLGAAGSALEGVRVVIPAGALSAATEITVRPSASAVALPSTATRCGPEFSIEPADLALAQPAEVTLPFDEVTVTANERFDDEVKVWALDGASGKWGQKLQTDGAAGSVTVQLQALTTVAAGVNPPASTDVVHFQLVPNPKFARCLAQYPDDPSRQPAIAVDVVRGDLNDGLFLKAEGMKPGLSFDLFTVEHSSLLADGTADPSFKNFGLAWYQSDVQADDNGVARVQIRTILLDQIFGFDPVVSLPPTGTFEVGFWFNDPRDAAACGFDVTKPTPFNGEHEAGPLAAISLPDATTGLGPLCTKPDTSVSPARCSP
ncbi:MAG: hypothetical protein JOZ69_25625 [Myxococcales bacterium]|nr:hypothetical protein [Myxococcales bacterium]